MGFGCGCGRTNLLKTNEPLGGSPFANLYKENIVGTGTNHVSAIDVLGISHKGGPGMLEVSKNINVKNLLRLLR